MQYNIIFKQWDLKITILMVIRQQFDTFGLRPASLIYQNGEIKE